MILKYNVIKQQQCYKTIKIWIDFEELNFFLIMDYWIINYTKR